MHTTTQHHEGVRTSVLARYLCLVALVAQLGVFGLSGRALAASCTPPGTTYGTDTVSLTVSATASYTFWVRLKVPAATNAAVLMRLNASNCYAFGTSAANAWQWTDYDSGNTAAVVHISLPKGTYSLLFTGLVNGAELDRIEAIPQGSCTPTGTGDNCVTAASASSGGGSTTTSGGGLTTTQSGGASTSSSGSTSSSAPVTVQPTQQAGVTKVEYLLNNQLIDTETTPPFSYTFNPTHYLNGTYTLTVKTYYSSGDVTTSSKQIVVKNTAFVEARLLAVKYLWLITLLLVALIGGVWYIRRRGNLAVASAAAGPEPSDFYDTYTQTTSLPTGGQPMTAVPPSLQGGTGNMLGYPPTPGSTGVDTSGMDIFEQPQPYPPQAPYAAAPPEPAPLPEPPTPAMPEEPTPAAPTPPPTPVPTPAPTPDPAPAPEDDGEGEFRISH